MDYASFLKRTRVLFCIQNQLARECLAELLAVFVLIVSGAGGGRGAGVGAEHGGLTALQLCCAHRGCLGVGGGCAGMAVTPNPLTSGLDPGCDSPRPSCCFTIREIES